MLSNMSLQQLAETVNTQLNQSNFLSSSDKRYSNELTPRRIRDYISQGLLEKPFKNGKLIYFTELHVNRLIALRTMQSDGLSDKYMKKLSMNTDFAEEVDNADMIKQQKALSLIDSIKNIGQSNNLSASYLLNSNSDHNTKKQLQILSRPQSKTWVEIPLDTENKYFFKMEAGSELKNKEQILNAIKEILNI